MLEYNIEFSIQREFNEPRGRSSRSLPINFSPAHCLCILKAEDVK